VEVKSAADLDGRTRNDVVKRLYTYWTERRGAKRFASRGDIDPLDFGFAIGWVSLIDIVGPPPVRFHYRLVSTELTRHLGYEMTGKFLDEIPEPEMQVRSRDFYTRALEAAAPFHERGEFVADARRWRHETLVLPLSADEATINMLLIYRRAEMPVAVPPGFSLG
jgi:hypothetical protein